MDGEFLQWLSESGGFVHPDVELFGKSGAGGNDRGVRAARPIAAGEPLLLIPLTATLHIQLPDITREGATLPATCNAEVAAFLESAQPSLSPFLATTLMLMSELAAAKDAAAAGGGSAAATPASQMVGSADLRAVKSRFMPYLATLPAATDCLVNWSDAERGLLGGTALDGVGARPLADVYSSDVLPRLGGATQLFLGRAGCHGDDVAAGNGGRGVNSTVSDRDDTPPGLALFRRAADLVQTRAFHMQADNWITGTSQEAAEALYLIPGVDMLNHSTDPECRNTSLALTRGKAEVALPGRGTCTFSDFFSMTAERDIAADEEVLHTYGQLSDAQLLQTYGFIDASPSGPPSVQEGSTAIKHGGSGSSSGGVGGGHAGAADGPRESGSSNPNNYVVMPLQDLTRASSIVATAARLWPVKRGDKLLQDKLEVLVSGGLLVQEQQQQQQQDDLIDKARLLLPLSGPPLPDSLLTILQVLMMTPAELHELREEQQQEQQWKGEAANTGRGAADGQQLSLGSELLTGEFGEICATALLQAIGACIKRYALDAASCACVINGDDAAATATAASALLERHRKGSGSSNSNSSSITPSRARLAAALALAEQQQWQLVKRAALELMLTATQGDGDDDDASDDDDDASDDDDSAVSEEDDGDVQGDKGGDANKTKQQQQKEQQQQQQQRGADRRAGRVAPPGKRQRRSGDTRSHFGDLTGPREEDVWQSGDSNQVGYSSDDSGGSSGGGGGGSGSTRGGRSAPQQRHDVSCGGQRHTYDVGPGGEVREAYGHMRGPLEPDWIVSDDSDGKVGYADDGEGEAGPAGRSQGD